MTPSRNTRSYTLRSVPSSPGRSFLTATGLHSGIIAFFITCAFAAPVDEEKGTLNQYINRISMHVTKTAMVVDAGFVIFFIVAIVKRETDWLKLGTHVYA